MRGGGGVMTSMRLRLVFFFLLLTFFCYVVVRCSGGEVMTSMRMRLVFFFLCLTMSAVHVQLTLILMLLMSQSFWWSFQDACCLTFHTSTMQKPRVFAAFQTKISQLTLKLNIKNTKSLVFATLSQKRCQKQKTLENEITETSCC